MEAGHRTATAKIHPRGTKKLARSGSLMEGDFEAVKASKINKSDSPVEIN
jgi:hypothetical protein